MACRYARLTVLRNLAAQCPVLVDLQRAFALSRQAPNQSHFVDSANAKSRLRRALCPRALSSQLQLWIDFVVDATLESRLIMTAERATLSTFRLDK